jgi:hypothetical protein
VAGNRLPLKAELEAASASNRASHARIRLEGASITPFDPDLLTPTHALWAVAVRRLTPLNKGNGNPGNPVRHRTSRTTKRPKELVGGPANRFVPAPNKSGVVTLRPGTLARWPCDHRTRFPDPSRGSLPGAVWRFAPAPSGRTKCTGRGRRPTTALSTNFAGIAPGLSPTFPPMWMACGRAALQHPRNVAET